MQRHRAARRTGDALNRVMPLNIHVVPADEAHDEDVAAEHDGLRAGDLRCLQPAVQTPRVTAASLTITHHHHSIIKFKQHN